MNNESFILGLVDGLEKTALGVGASAAGSRSGNANYARALDREIPSLARRKPEGLLGRVKERITGQQAAVSEKRKDVADQLRGYRSVYGPRVGREMLAGMKGEARRTMSTEPPLIHKNVGLNTPERSMQSAKEDFRGQVQPPPPKPPSVKPVPAELTGRVARPRYQPA